VSINPRARAGISGEAVGPEKASPVEEGLPAVDSTSLRRSDGAEGLGASAGL
jgi:hypothetical protein